MAKLFRIFDPNRGHFILASSLTIIFGLFLVVQKNWETSALSPHSQPSTAKIPSSRLDQDSRNTKPVAVKQSTESKTVSDVSPTENGTPPQKLDTSTSTNHQAGSPFVSDEVSSVAFQRRDDAFDDDVPATADDLQTMEDFIVEQVPIALASTVAIRASYIQGSGVIVSDDGFVLTAAHVAVKAGQKLDVILSDQREVAGETIFLDSFLDIAIVKLDGPGPWPASPIADNVKLAPGVWCLATGHSGGYFKERPAVVRLGRLIDIKDDYLESDCPLVGGDSGGPLFDMHGRVVGIHSRIGPTVSRNFHAPVVQFKKRWEEIVKTDREPPTQPDSASPPEVVRSPASEPKKPRALLGLFAEDIVRGCRVTEVLANQPADIGGVQLDDVILKIDQTTIINFSHLRELIRKKEPGEKVVLTIERNEQLIEEEVVLGSLETSS
ncbi:MAG: trypsin-like peptidase domain-containing protein [Planctomycetota bacterium]|nr:trypsin-like peptidase domain-containing protein [Planctomycetota bacterium]MDA1214750.1 trypsin-like peptidase domain-containing protein [Planctomycetota bacterium]